MLQETAYLPNAWLTLGRTHFVAQRHTLASDDNPGSPGSADRPFKTIAAAAALAEPYDRIVIDEGVYREEVVIHRHGSHYAPRSTIVFEAVPGKRVYVKGSDVFEPHWESLGDGVFAAPLPKRLFEPETYNPYALACAPRSCPSNYEFDRGGFNPRGNLAFQPPPRVRPAHGDVLPLTLGQIYMDGRPLEQRETLDEVRCSPGSFIVSADGRRIICRVSHESRLRLSDHLIELTVRRRCFRASFKLPWWGLMIQHAGIVAEHAAEPGAYSLCRPLTIRRDAVSGIVVRKTLHAVNRLSENHIVRSRPGYIDRNDPAILCTLADGSKPTRPFETPAHAMLSRDAGRTWTRVEEGPLTKPASYFLDDKAGMLLRYYQEKVRIAKPQAALPRALPGAAPGWDSSEKKNGDEERDWGWGPSQYVMKQEVSPDAGRTWSQPRTLDLGTNPICFSMLPLASGRLFWVTCENRPHLSPLRGLKPDPFFFIVQTWLGQWRTDRSDIDWKSAGQIQIDPARGWQGLDEPHVCQFPDGRLFAIMRQCAVLPTAESPGFPSVKLISLSEDEGLTWTEPRPLTFDDGKVVYSPTSIGDAFRSSKNGRVYVILNILNGPTQGCLPRCVLHLAEIDTTTAAIKRDSVTVIEEALDDHARDVAFSNWARLEDRATKNIVLFMKMDNPLFGRGYDCNSHRYEIELP